MFLLSENNIVQLETIGRSEDFDVFRCIIDNDIDKYAFLKNKITRLTDSYI